MKLIQWCKEHDKLSHFFIIGLFTLIFNLLIGIYTIIPISIIAIGKEIYDDFKVDRTGFDINDLLTDYLAYIIVSIIYLIL